MSEINGCLSAGMWKSNAFLIFKVIQLSSVGAVGFMSAGFLFKQSLSVYILTLFMLTASLLFLRVAISGALELTLNQVAWSVVYLTGMFIYTYTQRIKKNIKFI